MKTISKKIIASITMVVSVIVLSGSSAFSQCQKVGQNCAGNCDPAWYYPGQTPIVAGVPACTPVNGKCKCALTVLNGTWCRVVNGNKCGGFCPRLYPSFQDALDSTNAIPGRCMRDGANCGCVWTK